MSTREAGEPTREALLKGLILASEGTGPLLQRDYWAVIENCALTPPELADRLRRDVASFAPEDIVQFERTSEPGAALEPGDEMEVKIRMAGSCRVRVLHKDRNSLTLGTVR